MTKHSNIVQNFIEKLIKTVVTTLRQEGRSIVRERGILIGQAIANSLRIILLLHYTILMLCFLAAMSLFSTLLLGAIQYSESSTLHLTLPLTSCGILFATSVLLLWISVNRRTWNKALRIEHWVDSLLGVDARSTSTPSAINSEALEGLINDILAKKLSELARTAQTQASRPDDRT